MPATINEVLAVGASCLVVYLIYKGSLVVIHDLCGWLLKWSTK